MVHFFLGGGVGAEPPSPKNFTYESARTHFHLEGGMCPLRPPGATPLFIPSRHCFSPMTNHRPLSVSRQFRAKRCQYNEALREAELIAASTVEHVTSLNSSTIFEQLSFD